MALSRTTSCCTLAGITALMANTPPMHNAVLAFAALRSEPAMGSAQRRYGQPAAQGHERCSCCLAPADGLAAHHPIGAAADQR